jgi:hypothetical protein
MGIGDGPAANPRGSILPTDCPSIVPIRPSIRPEAQTKVALSGAEFSFFGARRSVNLRSRTTPLRTAMQKAPKEYPKLKPGSLLCALLFAILSALGGLPAAQAQSDPLKIGIIGTGKIGGALARHWAQAGHELVISSRHPHELEALAEELGPKVRAAAPAVAASFGDVVLVSVPYGAMPQIGRDYGDLLAGKVVLDTGNPIPRRDGEMAVEALEKGSGIASAEFLPGARLVRAFNCIPAWSLANRANRKPERIAIPIAGDDPAALEAARRLVDDAGFDAVVVGPLMRAGAFDLGHALAKGHLTATELQRLVDERW